MDIQTKDGILLRGIPDGTPDEEIKARIAAIRGESAQKVKPTMAQSVQASAPMRLVQGMRDPIDAGAQALSHMAPQWLTSALDYLPGKMRNSDSPLLQTIGDRVFADPRPQAVDATLRQTEDQYQAARTAVAQGDPGFDAMRLTGNVVSPANAAIARVLPAGAMATAPRMAATGTALGAAGGLLSPVLDEAGQEDYFGTKGTQMGVGAITGGLLTPVIGKTMQAAAPYVQRGLDGVTGRTARTQAEATRRADEALRAALDEVGQRIDDIPRQQLDALRGQVAGALREGRQIDAAALLRRQDFDAIGVPGTLGQITRDPSQFAREKNLRGVAGVGEPLLQRFDAQNRELQNRIGALANGASDNVTAGENIMGALGRYGAARKSEVDTAYGLARDHVGRAAPMDSFQFHQAANRSLDESMLGVYLPTEARTYLNGIATGEIPFNVNTAVQIDQVLSSAQRAARGTPQALAIGRVRDALNAAPIADNVGVDAKAAFDAARQTARQYHSTLDAIPALRAAAEGSVHPDDFVRRFVIRGNAAEVRRMANVLRDGDPAAFHEARAQIGAQIQRAAFGENLAGDKAVSPERLAKAIRDIGTEKLSAFFSASEIDGIRRMARVGAYMNSVPANAAVNTSNTAAAMMNLMGGIPGVSPGIQALRAIATPIMNQRAVSTAVAANVPETLSPATPELLRRLQATAAMGGLLGSNAAVPR